MTNRDIIQKQERMEGMKKRLLIAALAICMSVSAAGCGKGGQETEKVDRKGGQKTKTREAILGMITQNSKVTSTQMAEALGINRSAVSKHLKKMQEDGIIKREGPDKGGKWVVLNNNR